MVYRGRQRGLDRNSSECISHILPIRARARPWRPTPSRVQLQSPEPDATTCMIARSAPATRGSRARVPQILARAPTREGGRFSSPRRERWPDVPIGFIAMSPSRQAGVLEQDLLQRTSSMLATVQENLRSDTAPRRTRPTLRNGGDLFRQLSLSDDVWPRSPSSNSCSRVCRRRPGPRPSAAVSVPGELEVEPVEPAAGGPGE